MATDATAGRGSWPWMVAAALIAAVVCLWYATHEVRLTGAVTGFPLDDSYIHLQFARNLAFGRGLSYQGARWIGGSTAPLWTGLLSLAFLVPAPLFAVKLLGVAAFAGTTPAMFVLARRYDLAPGLAFLGALLLGLCDALVWSALSAMEVPLFVLLSTWGLVLHDRERRERRGAASTLLFAAACLVRPEGLLLLALSGLDRGVRFGRDPHDSNGSLGLRRGEASSLVAVVMVAAVVLLPTAVFHLFAHGSPLPTTFLVKTAASHSWWPALRDLFRAAEVLFRSQPWALLFAGAGLVSLLERLGTERERSLLPALWLVGLPLALATMAAPGTAVNLGNFGRYVFPLFPSLVLLGTLGLARIWVALVGARPGPRWRTAAALLAVVVVLPTARAMVAGAGRYALSVANVAASDVAAGRWIASHLPAEARLAVQDIGAIAYYAPNPLLDLVGIVNPEIRRVVEVGEDRAPLARLGRLFGFVERAGADFLVLFPESYGGLRTLEDLVPGLVVVHRIEVPQNITMAGSELLVIATPWSRFGPGSSAQGQ